MKPRTARSRPALGVLVVPFLLGLVEAFSALAEGPGTGVLDGDVKPADPLREPGRRLRG